MTKEKKKINRGSNVKDTCLHHLRTGRRGPNGVHITTCKACEEEFMDFD